MEWEVKLKEAFSEQAKLWEEYKSSISTDLKDGKELSSQTKEKVEKMEIKFAELETTIQTATKAIEEKKAVDEAMDKKLKDFEARLQRSGSNGARAEKKNFVVPELYNMAVDSQAEEKAANTWKALQFPGRVTMEEKALSYGDPETGGYLGTPELVNEIIKEMREVTPVMQVAKVRTTSANQIDVPKKTGTITAKRRGEQEAKTATEGLTYGLVTMPLPEMYCYLDVTEMDLEDTMFNLEAEIREEFTDAFNAKLGAEFISGEGPLQLEGLLTNADIATLNSGVADNIAADTIIGLCVAGLKIQHQPNAQLLMNLSTVSAIRQLKNSTTNAYIWAPGFGETPNTICGKRYVASEDMADIAANAYPIIIGDFKKGYTVGLRVRIGIKRITDSSLDQNGLVRFSGRLRVGGKVVLAPAIKKYKCAA